MRLAALHNINRSMARSKMTNVGTVLMEEQQRLSSRSCLIAFSASWQCSTHVPLRCVIVVCETQVWKLPWRLTYMNLQHQFSAVCWEQIK
jgi:hypothetical protein